MYAATAPVAFALRPFFARAPMARGSGRETSHSDIRKSNLLLHAGGPGRGISGKLAREFGERRDVAYDHGFAKAQCPLQASRRLADSWITQVQNDSQAPI